MKRCIIFVLICVFLFQFIEADVISLNSGGTGEIIINPDKYIEGFFSGDIQVLSGCGDGIIQAGETCDDGNTVSGDGCSSSCATETITPPDDDGGGGGGGTGKVYITVDPEEIVGHVLINSNLEENIGVVNLDNSKPATFSVYPSGFYSDLIVSIWDDKNDQWVDSLSLTVPAGGIANVRVRFSAQSFIGNYTGSIILDGHMVQVTLIVQEKLLLFDSNIVVLNNDYLVSQGDKLRTSVTLIPLGDEERMDVTLNYVIKDYDDKVYLTRSETVLVENQVNFKRSFDTGFLPLGKYIIGLELIYSNGVAPSSAHFEVTSATQNAFFGKLVFTIVNIILIILIIIIFVTVFKMVRRMIKEKSKGFPKNLR